ncbi:MAG TPA: helix-turn-helix transcriptional regulator [Longimicrobium sp.]|nr:helix-turn-helix transcriptional regulator [Longimicrobium sp.]
MPRRQQRVQTAAQGGLRAPRRRATFAAGPVARQNREDILKQFGETLRSYRLEADLSQERLAANAGLDRTYVGGAERGERNVALVNIVRLGQALGVRPSQLLEPFQAKR